jgi:uncharacterized protein (TIGR00251 family)
MINLFALIESKRPRGVVLNLKVMPSQPRFEVLGWDDGLQALKIKTKSAPVKGKANQEIEKELSKFFGSPTRLVAGLKGKTKKVRIAEKSLEHVLAQVQDA